MQHSAVLIHLASEEDTSRLGDWLSARLSPGDTVLLEGPIGSGKSHLARAIIRHRLGSDEDVPSPTFTLVQTYALPAGGEIWHADLYRLVHPDEVIELGLDHAFGQEICLVEWPDRLGDLAPAQALRITFHQQGEGRDILVQGSTVWADRLKELQETWND
ncbi:MAG: tRNA (adenosine(37)-N6)-threonylcarbamoyltransferase complex ATPase subunit type 1 TsaE [Cereibacter sphaeroides]|uniref:tRNA threonylcarbamoyladenosine biosynthesis protein TsaE n=1 Tax=Cereibacter sphaeroides TaxID=1063 RepID=A0A2W5S802_CERSP|nr:MAG: tRNA (adenosine(37)-N6)-threonylcarbamoyltransferase complex ATPase subunit type 1 TsaE [Cereibacter sphaeroides]